MDYNTNYYNKNNIPATPSAKTIENINNEAFERFGGIIWITIENDCIEDYLSVYDYWEPYNENISYSRRIYQAAYKGKIKDYQQNLCIVNSNTKENEKYYVIARRILNELDKLEEYCECIICNSYFFNPLKYIWCPNCVGCISSGKGFAKEELIIKAKNKKSKNIRSDSNILLNLKNYIFNAYNIDNYIYILIILTIYFVS